jgi:hypothetical protein
VRAVPATRKRFIRRHRQDDHPGRPGHHGNSCAPIPSGFSRTKCYSLTPVRAEPD